MSGLDGAGGNHHLDGQAVQRKSYSDLYVKFITLTLICSVVPILLVGYGIYRYYSEFSTARMEEYFQRKVEYNQNVIELFLKERTADLTLVALSHPLEYLKEPANLKRLFGILNHKDPYFDDLGVIGENGKHLAYHGPFDLMDKDYSETFWFKGLLAKGVYISDMFMGYRKIPHFIIAILRSEGGTKWILRATIFTESLSSLLQNVKIGRSGEVFLLNEQGIYQTSPRLSGKIMMQSPFDMKMFSGDSGVRMLEYDSEETGLPETRQVVAYSWLKEPRWLLVVKQDQAEVLEEVSRANRAIMIFLSISIIAILIVSVITTRHMIKTIQKRDEGEERLNKQLLQASKLASIGELAAGVAHEINNPLAVILTENQLVRDMADEATSFDGEFKQQLYESMDQIDAQIHRCSRITQNLLRFSRRIRSKAEMVDINACFAEVIELIQKRAQTNGVQIVTEFEPGLPSLLTDAFQLEQVLLNCVNNGIDAHDGKPYGTIRVKTRHDEKRNGIELRVSDTGSGIPPEHLDRIFDPFYTTKPVGKGTGLGLSISYSIIKSLGGEISVNSEVGKGTDFIIFLPLGSQGAGREEAASPS